MNITKTSEDFLEGRVELESLIRPIGTKRNVEGIVSDNLKQILSPRNVLSIDYNPYKKRYYITLLGDEEFYYIKESDVWFMALHNKSSTDLEPAEADYIRDSIYRCGR